MQRFIHPWTSFNNPSDESRELKLEVELLNSFYTCISNDRAINLSIQVPAQVASRAGSGILGGCEKKWKFTYTQTAMLIALDYRLFSVDRDTEYTGPSRVKFVYLILG
jgi:hypothetical protein